MILWACCLVVEVAAAVLAWRRAPRSPLVWLLTFAPASDVAIKLLQAFALDAAPRPLVGMARVLYHVETALVLAWPAALAAVAWRVFGSVTRRTVINPDRGHKIRRWSYFLPETPIALAWALAVAVLVLSHPLPRGWTAPLLRAWTLAAVAVGVVAVVRAWRSPASWGRSAVHHAVLLLLGTEAAVAIVGPYVRDPFADWDAARLLYLVGFAGVCAVLSKARRRGAAAAL